MKDKLTKPMRLTLAAMSDEWRSAYEIGASLNMLEALRYRGLVRSRNELGYMAFPRNNIFWQITNEGKQALGEVTA